MLCQEFEKLTPLERSKYVGELIHAAMNSNLLFEEGKRLINKGKKMKLFEGVTINPQPTETENIPDRLKNQ